MNSLSTALVLPTLRHNGERYASCGPRICGTLPCRTPSPVFSVPVSEPLREPPFSPPASYRPRPQATACASSSASGKIRSVDRRTNKLHTASPLCPVAWPGRKARRAWAFCSLGALFFSLPESSFFLVVHRLHNLIPSRRSVSRLLPSDYRDSRT